jgi:hypothetical protein
MPVTMGTKNDIKVAQNLKKVLLHLKEGERQHDLRKRTIKYLLVQSLSKGNGNL